MSWSDLIPPSPFLVCPPVSTSGTSGILVDLDEIDLRIQLAWLSCFSRATRGHADVEDFLKNVGDWLHTKE